MYKVQLCQGLQCHAKIQVINFLTFWSAFRYFQRTKIIQLTAGDCCLEKGNKEFDQAQ